MSSSERPSKAESEQKPSSPRALATALGSLHSDKNAPKPNRLAMLEVRYMLQFRWRCAECQILSLPVPLPVFSASSPKLQALVYDILPFFGGRCRKAVLGVCSSPKHPAPYRPSQPLHLSLPSLHPASCPLDTPAPQCSHAPSPAPPPSLPP